MLNYNFIISEIIINFTVVGGEIIISSNFLISLNGFLYKNTFTFLQMCKEVF